jgi:hypothetical protein
MRSVAIVVVWFIVLFSTSGWSDIQYHKIPTPPEEPAQSQVETPEKPAQTDIEKESSNISPSNKSAAPKTGDRQTEPLKSEPPKIVDANKPKPNGSYITSLQVGSFQTLDQARKEASRLKALGVDVFIRNEKARGTGNRYRVYIGKFNSKRQALDYEKELKHKGIIYWSWIKRLRVNPNQMATATAPATKPSPDASATAPATKSSPDVKAAASQTSSKKIDRKSPRFKRPIHVVSKPAPVQTKPERPVVAKKVAPRTPPPAIHPKSSPPPPPPPKKSTRKTASKGKKQQHKRFYLGSRAGLLYAPGTSDFRITQTIDSNAAHWEFENLKPIVGLNSGWQFNDHWFVDAVVERTVMTNLDMLFLTLGPKRRFSDSETNGSYLRAALVYGKLAWDDAPGDFDPSMGAEIGYGIDFIGSQFSLGLEAAYRYITFDYNSPSGTEVTSTDSQIDFSGFTLTICARAHF